MFSYRTGNGKVRTLATLGVVNDRTPDMLRAWGWKLVKSPVGSCDWTGWWVDPSTGEAYSISQAEAIRRDRLTPRYRFVQTTRR